MLKTIKTLKVEFLITIMGLMLLLTPSINNKLISGEKEVQRYGLLIDQFAPNSNDPNSCSCNAIEFRDSLITNGWSEDNFQYLFGDDEITRLNLQIKMDDLEETVDANDVLVIFFGTHGHTCLRDVLHFNDWFHEEFLEIKTDYKILLIDSCHASEFITPLLPYNQSESFYAMGSVSAEEFAIGFDDNDAQNWQYSEPLFYGIISAHFWSEALVDSMADSNKDDFISLQEMYNYSFPKIRAIYSEVFEFNPDLAQYILDNTGYIDNYPNPEVIQNLPEDFSLDYQYLNNLLEETAKLSQGAKIALIVGPIGGVLFVGTVVLLIFVRKKKAINV
ncbi:hypothetical protein EU523_00250 [Candidatus Heimdallarchaeota archaeon]|nr:MAG: hypothetical protein EU523_00250 [Candidatus Heimdallarchaeota archaeon]